MKICEMTRVAFFADILIKDFDGASRTMFQIIERINKSRYNYLFITGMKPKNRFDFPLLETPAMSIPMNNTYKIALPQFYQKKLEEYLDRFDPEVIHIASPSFLGNAALQYGKKNNIPVLSIYHTHFISYVEYYCRFTPFLSKLVRQRVKRSLKNFYENCDSVLVPTTQMTKDFKDMGINTKNHMVWPRGLDSNLFNPNKHDPDFIKKIVKNNRPNILFASRLVWEKNLSTLAKVYELAEQKNLKFNFIIAGDGVAKNTLERKMPNAYFLGKVDHNTLAKVYASSDVFLFPSYSETYGNVVIEAMASGLPCVIANGGGSKSFIDQGINGFVCENNNPYDYLDKLCKVVFNNDLNEQFQSKGITYTQNLNWDTLVDNYFIEIDRLTNKPIPQLV